MPCLRARDICLSHEVEADLEDLGPPRLVVQAEDAILEGDLNDRVVLLAVVDPLCGISPWVISLHLPHRSIAMGGGAFRRCPAQRGGGHGRGCPSHLDGKGDGQAVQVSDLAP